MNPAFIILVLIGALVLWALLNPLFRLFGEAIQSLLTDIKNEMSDNNESEDN